MIGYENKAIRVSLLNHGGLPDRDYKTDSFNDIILDEYGNIMKLKI